jgi:ubiquinone/menaquinone biosynthesis C-methylase UbiE
MTDMHAGFRNVDQNPDASAFFSFLDAANALESIQAYRQKLVELCPPKAGDDILDIGCGLGHGTRELARRVGSSGSVYGIDKSDALIAEAQRRIEDQPLSPVFQVGDAQQLSFEDSRFDVCRTERVLMYVDKPDQALDEMLRVLRPGGQVAMFEFDYECIVVDAPDAELTDRLMSIISSSIPSPRIGRLLPRLLRERGVEPIVVLPHFVSTPLEMFRRVVGGTIDEAVHRSELASTVVERWWRELEQSDLDGHFFAGFFGLIVCGRLPD